MVIMALVSEAFWHLKDVEFVNRVIERINMSARAYDRILKVARTVADLEGTADVLDHHIIARHQPNRNLDRPTYLGSSL